MDMRVDLAGWVLALAAGLCGAAGAGEAVYAEGYEETVPGTAPKDWKRAWGDMKEDRIVVTNEKAAAGDQAMMVEHAASNEGQWGMALNLPKPAGDTATVSFKFQVDGAGGGFSAEIRDGNGKDRLSAFNVGNSRLFAWVDGKRPTFGKIENGVWYAVVMTFPLGDAAEARTALSVTNIATGEVSTGNLNAKPPQAFGKLFINIPPKSPDFRLYLDDVEVR